MASRTYGSTNLLGKFAIVIGVLTLILGSLFNPLAAIVAAILWLFGLSLLASSKPEIFSSGFLAVISTCAIPLALYALTCIVVGAATITPLAFFMPLITAFLLIILVYPLTIIAGYLMRRHCLTMDEVFKTGFFDTAGKLAWYGGLTTIILIGFLLIPVALLLYAYAVMKT